MRGLYITDEGAARNILRRYIAPTFSIVHAHVHQAIVAARPQHTGFDRAFRKRKNSGVGFGTGNVQRNGPAAWLQGFRIVQGEVRADGLPGLAAIQTAVHEVGGGV